MTALKLYCFGDKYDDVRLKNGMISEVVHLSEILNATGRHQYTTSRAINFVYENTSEAAKLRELWYTHTPDLWSRSVSMIACQPASSPVSWPHYLNIATFTAGITKHM